VFETSVDKGIEKNSGDSVGMQRMYA
jgi:hypothetical protein